MRKLAVAVGCSFVLAACALLGAPGSATVKVRLQLLDSATGKDVGGMLRVVPADAKKPAELPGLVDRLLGLNKSDRLSGWYVVPAAGAETTLRPGLYRFEALSGLETVVANLEGDLTENAVVSLKLNSLFRPEDRGLVAEIGRAHV